MALTSRFADVLLRAAAEAAVRGEEESEKVADLIATTLFPTEAERLVKQLEVVLAAARKVAGLPGNDEQAERQRAADRVSAFLDGPGWVGGVIAREDGHELTVDDLRLLVQAAPVLPPKWSHVLANPTLHVVVQSTHRREEAVQRLRALIEWSASDPDGNSIIFQHDGVQLRRSDLELLLAEDGEILLATHNEGKAAELAREHDHASVTVVAVQG